MGGIVTGKARPVTDEELERYRAVQELQREHVVPLLHRAGDPHSYHFLAFFDGTGQDARDPRQLLTNVGILARQAETAAREPGLRVGQVYVEGIGTQSDPLRRAVDGALALTWDEKIEKAYQALASQAWLWMQQDPNARISVASVGYSRGAVLAPGLARLVDEYGIVDPTDLRFGRDAHGNITVESTRPPLVPPRQVPQAVGLFDPVGTQMPRNYDARLNPRVVSGFSLLAADELRKWFPHHSIVDIEMTPDRRFLGVTVAGGHSNVGGGNRDPGLESMAFNAMVDYLNALGDRPLFRTRPLPEDPSLYTVHQAGGPTAGFGLALDGDGRRDIREELANCRIVDPCRDGVPVDEATAARLPWRTVQPSWSVPRLALEQDVAVAPRAVPTPDDPSHPDHATLERIRAGIRAIDAQVGKPYDAASEQLSRGLLVATKETGDASGALTRVDHVVLGRDGRYVFAVEGALDDPAHRRVGVPVEQAMRTPPEAWDARLEEANHALAREHARHQAVPPAIHRGADEPAPGALTH